MKHSQFWTFIFAASQIACTVVHWPHVSPSMGVVKVVPEEGTGIEIDITDDHGQTAYKLSCRSGESEDDDFNYSGLFHCRLVAHDIPDELPSLLLDEAQATSDWQGRARFLLNDVIGSCGDVADWGSVRTFRLRGMQITLAVRDVTLSGIRGDFSVRSFQFEYEIQPDSTAHTSIAQKSLEPEPKWFASSTHCVDEVLPLGN